VGGRGGGGAPGGHHGGGLGRGLNHRQPQGPEGGRRGVSFEDATDYDHIGDARTLFEDEQYPPLHRAFSDAEYEAQEQSIFHPDGAPPMNNDARGLLEVLFTTSASTRVLALVVKRTSSRDLCPHLPMSGIDSKAWVYTLL